MVKRLVLGLVVVLALLVAVAAYFLRTPESAAPVGPIEAASLEVSGRTRSYLVFVPSQLKPGASVMLALHASQGSARKMRRIVGGAIERIAERENIVVVYPDGHEGHFNDCRRVASYSARMLDIDDVGFMRQIVHKLAVQRKIDPERVYAVGYSNGAHMALRLALEAPDLVRGAGVIAANLPAPDNMACRVSPKPSRYIVFVEGTDDPINPYEGGKVTLFGFGNRGHVLSAEESAVWFAKKLGLSRAESARPAADPQTRTQDWTVADGHVRLVTLVGGGHTVPQRDYRFQRILGKTHRSDAVLESMWQLFDSGR